MTRNLSKYIAFIESIVVDITRMSID